MYIQTGLPQLNRDSPITLVSHPVQKEHTEAGILQLLQSSKRGFYRALKHMLLPFQARGTCCIEYLPLVWTDSLTVLQAMTSTVLIVPTVQNRCSILASFPPNGSLAIGVKQRLARGSVSIAQSSCSPLLIALIVFMILLVHQVLTASMIHPRRTLMPCNTESS
jgi:hypothetical protein